MSRSGRGIPASVAPRANNPENGLMQVCFENYPMFRIFLVDSPVVMSYSGYMFISEGSQITRKEARFFLEPANATHRQYEALRAYFVEGLFRRPRPPPLRLHPGQLPRPGPPVSPRPGASRSSCPQPKGPRPRPSRPAARPDRRPAQAEPSRSTTSAGPWPGGPSAQPGGGRADPQGGRALPGCPDGAMTNGPPPCGPPSPTWPMSGNSTCRRGSSGPSSAGCSCSCPGWRRSPWTGSWPRPACPARR